nr:MAG TPA: hypothetical protein [Caudoviricetes sp.]
MVHCSYSNVAIGVRFKGRTTPLVPTWDRSI